MNTPDVENEETAQNAPQAAPDGGAATVRPGGAPGGCAGLLGDSAGLLGDSAGPLVIVLPLPPRELHPNARVHPMALHRAKKDYRRACGYNAVQGAWDRRPPHCTFESPVLDVRAYFPVSRRRDRDGLISSLKTAVDFMTDWGLWADDSLVRWGSVEFGVDRGNPRVEITVSEGEEE